MNNPKMQLIWNTWFMPYVIRIILAATMVVGVMIIATPVLVAQEEVIAVGTEVNQWTQQRTIPGYHPETEPPILITDQAGTVHAFSYQWLGEEGESPRAIMYNQWTGEQGWTMPVDIMLSPFMSDARLLDAHMDASGMMHILFFGGDGEGANVYYAKVPATEAGQSSSWSKPVFIGSHARDPEDGILAGDNQGNLLIIYSGEKYGTGWYTVTSADDGKTWSKSTLIFPTYDFEFSPFYLKTHLGDSGLLHTVWSVNDISNHGTAIFYTNYDFVTKQWSETITLAERIDGLGTMVPNIIEYDDNLFVMYYRGSTGRQYFTRSSDGGRSWSDPITPFPHVGLNGVTNFVVDSNGDLHFFWAQRVTFPNTGQVQGLWHSTWQDTGWSDFEAVVTGRKLIDNVGFEAFDANTTRVAISRGNHVLVTWRTDRGSRGNGVWYSTATLDAPELPALPLPTVPSALVADSTTLVSDNAADSIVETPVPTRAAIPEFRDQVDLPDVVDDSPAKSLIIGFAPIVLLILSIFIIRQLSQYRHRS